MAIVLPILLIRTYSTKVRCSKLKGVGNINIVHAHIFNYSVQPEAFKVVGRQHMFEKRSSRMSLSWHHRNISVISASKIRTKLALWHIAECVPTGEDGEVKSIKEI